MKTTRFSPFALRLLAGAIAVALIAGATVLAARRAESTLRADLLLKARLVSVSLCPERVAKLTGTAADYTSPDYLHVHDLLMRIRVTTPHCRFLYLMERRPDGVVIFTNDSDPFDSIDHSPPGQTYDEAPAELHAVFAANQAIVRGPYGDRWGTWVSAFVPLSDPKSTMLGMDIDARDWKQEVALRAALPAVLTAIAILFGLLAILLQQSRRKHRARQAELHESEAQKRAILDGINTNIALVDQHLRILWANRAAANSVNKRTEDLVGQPCYSFWGDPSKPCVNCPTVTAFQTGKTEHQIIHTPDGRIWDETGEPLFDADGNVVAVVEIASDITDRKQAEEHIHELLKTSEQSRRALLGILEEQKRAEEQLRVLSLRDEAILAAIPEIVMQVDVNKVYTWANRVGLEFFGDDVIGREASSYFEGEQETYDIVTPLFGGAEDVIRVASWQRRKDGEKRLLVWLCHVLKDPQGQVIGALSTAQDITEQRMADDYRAMGVEVLQLLNEPGDLSDAIQRVIAMLKTRTGFDAVGMRLQDGEDFPYFVQDGFPTEFLLTENTLIERRKDGGVCRDEDGHVCLECTCGLVISGKTDPANPLFTRGGSFWTNDSFPLLDLPADQDPRLHPRNTCIHQGYASVALVPIRTKDRIVGLLHLNDRRKGRFTLGTVELLEGIASHIGEELMRKRAEEEKGRLEAQLQQAQKMEAVGRLAGGVAHDFNNLLMGIMGYVDLCQGKIAPDHPIREWLDEIMHDAKRSVEITRQLLAFARKQTIAPRVLDLNDAVAGMLNLLRRLIGEDITLTWRPGANLRPVKLDPAQVDQVLANLCVNARDAIGGVGEITLETGNTTFDADYCATHPEAIPGAYVFLAVSDDGCGMDKETLAQVFEPFFTTKGLGKGTGLGLATVYGIVKQNNGFINVYSEPGRGTTFTIYLPEGAARTVATTVTSKAKAPRGRGETILLVEDEKSLRAICGLFLKALGYEVLLAETPGEALKVVDQHPGDIHLLLTDVVMPGMDGRQLAQRISAAKPGVKVVFMSGYTADVIARRGVLDEGVQFLSKPFTRDDLARKMGEVLEGSRPG